MATKSKLERAVESQAADLNDAQKEIVLSQFAIYKLNKHRIEEIDLQLRMLDPHNAHSVRVVQERQLQRSPLMYERNQLATSNSQIASDLFRLLSGSE